METNKNSCKKAKPLNKTFIKKTIDNHSLELEIMLNKKFEILREKIQKKILFQNMKMYQNMKKKMQNWSKKLIGEKNG